MSKVITDETRKKTIKRIRDHGHCHLHLSQPLNQQTNPYINNKGFTLYI